jgi:hypothetical protein
LPYKQFNLFVIPNDYNKKYDDSTKLFAFFDVPVIPSQSNDSIRLYVFQAFQKIEKKKAANNKQAKKNTPSLKYLKNFDVKEIDLLQPIQLNFETPIQLNDSFPIVLADTLNNPLKNYIIKRDTINTNSVTIDYPWTPSTRFHLIIPQKAIHDTLNNVLVKSDTLSLLTKSNISYGSLLLRVNGYEQFKNPILLLTQDDKIKFQYQLTQNLLNIPLLPPGDFQLKVLEDENNNGKWDTGKYGFGYGKKQPEKIWLVPTRLNIRADWENELNVSINK